MCGRQPGGSVLGGWFLGLNGLVSGFRRSGLRFGVAGPSLKYESSLDLHTFEFSMVHANRLMRIQIG